MDIRQIVYTSTEQGWQDIYVDPQTSRAARDFFNTIKANAPKAPQMYALDYSDGIYIYSRSVIIENDSFGRARHLAHGYIFYERDEYEAFENINRLLNIDGFLTSYEETVVPMEELPQKGVPGKRVAAAQVESLMSCVFEAIFEGRTMEIVHSGADYEEMKKILWLIYSNLPVLMRPLVTFATCKANRPRTVVFVEEKSEGAQIFYDTARKVGSAEGSFYHKLAENLTENKEAFLAELASLMAESGKHISDNREAMRDVAEKIRIMESAKNGIVSVSAKEIIERGKYADRFYMEQLLLALSEGKTDVEQYTEKLVEIYDSLSDRNQKDRLAESLLVLASKGKLSPEKLFKAAKGELSEVLVEKMLRESEYSGIAAVYTRLFFTDKELLSADGATDLMGVRGIELFALTASEYSDEEIMKFLSITCQNCPEVFGRLEMELVTLRKEELLMKFYTQVILPQIDNRYTISGMYDHLCALGAGDGFVKASADKYCRLCVKAYQQGEESRESVINEVIAYLAIENIDPQEYIAEIIDAFKEGFWQNFSWEMADFDQSFEAQFADKELATDSVCGVVKRVFNIISAVSDGIGIVEADEDYIELFTTDKFIKSADERRTVLRRLCNINPSDFDLTLLLAQATSDKGKLSFALDAEALKEYLVVCISDNLNHFIGEKAVFKALKKKVQKAVKTDDHKKRVLTEAIYLLDEYGEMRLGIKPKKRKAIKVFVRPAKKDKEDIPKAHLSEEKEKKMQVKTKEKYFGLYILCAIICALSVTVPMHFSQRISDYFKGVIDISAIYFLVGLCVIDAFAVSGAKSKKAKTQALIIDLCILALCVVVRTVILMFLL